jgi:hypothetical protein
MRTCKVIVGIICLVIAIFSALLAVSRAHNTERYLLDPVVLVFLMSAFALSTFALVAIGVLAIAKRHGSTPTKTAASFLAAILTTILLQASLLASLRPHPKTAADMITEDLQRLDAALKQTATPSNPSSNNTQKP